MGASVYYYDIDLNKNELLNARLHPVTTVERTALANTYNSNDKGIIVYDTTLDTFFGWNGNDWGRIGITDNELAMIVNAYNGTIASASLSSNSENLLLTLTKRDNTGISASIKFKHVHVQAVAATDWNIIHDLNCFPSVTIVDATKTEVIGNIEYVNLNSLRVTFSAAFSGEAYLN
jgi:hypothetical protein